MTDNDFYRIATELGCKTSSSADSPEGIISPYKPNFVFASYNYYGKFVHFWYENLDFDTAEALRVAIICHLKIEKDQCEAKRLNDIKEDFK